MRQVMDNLVLGAIIGVAFGFFKVPPPVPPTLVGLAGIIGIFLGWYVLSSIR